MTGRARQGGVTLIEVLVALLVMCVGLLGAAALQLNALKYTDSSKMASQASFVAYDMMDRIRANAGVDTTYALAAISAAPAANASVARDQDLNDFKTNIIAFAGARGTGVITVVKHVVTITIGWDDSRAVNTANSMQYFTVTSRVAVDDTATSSQ